MLSSTKAGLARAMARSPRRLNGAVSSETVNQKYPQEAAERINPVINGWDTVNDRHEHKKSSSVRYEMRNLSWASPESDFTAATASEMAAPATERYEMRNLSWASPESDFTAATASEMAAPATERYEMRNLSWASPESDFCAAPRLELNAGASGLLALLDAFLQYPSTLSFASPESDFAAYLGESSQPVSKPKAAEPEGQAATPASVLTEFSSASEATRRNAITIVEALAPSGEARVLTSAAAPFAICHVNGAWEALCGYRGPEVYGKSLNLIQGRLTPSRQLKQLEASLSRGEPARARLVNYHKSGRGFKNDLAVTPVVDEKGNLTHFLGTLSYVGDADDHLSKKDEGWRGELLAA